jgi:hypothetical protein
MIPMIALLKTQLEECPEARRQLAELSTAMFDHELFREYIPRCLPQAIGRLHALRVTFIITFS